MRTLLLNAFVYVAIALAAVWIALELRPEMAPFLAILAVSALAVAAVGVVRAAWHAARWRELLKLLESGRLEAFFALVGRFERDERSRAALQTIAAHRMTGLVYAGRFGAAEGQLRSIDESRLPVESRLAMQYNRVLLALLRGSDDEARALHSHFASRTSRMAGVVPFLGDRLRLVEAMLDLRSGRDGAADALRGLADRDVVGAAVRALANAELCGCLKGDEERLRRSKALALGHEMVVAARLRER